MAATEQKRMAIVWDVTPRRLVEIRPTKVSEELTDINSSETSVSNYANRKFRPIPWTLIGTYVVNTPPRYTSYTLRFFFASNIIKKATMQNSRAKAYIFNTGLCKILS